MEQKMHRLFFSIVRKCPFYEFANYREKLYNPVFFTWYLSFLDVYNFHGDTICILKFSQRARINKVLIGICR